LRGDSVDDHEWKISSSVHMGDGDQTAYLRCLMTLQLLAKSQLRLFDFVHTAFNAIHELVITSAIVSAKHCI
jgi:hypothetical protein